MEAVNRRRIVILAVSAALLLAVGGCGSSSSTSSAPAGSSISTAGTSTTSFAKTKFVLHAGLAFGAFHRWVYKPAKAGELTHPLQHKLTTLKAVAAAAFVYHELKLALAAAQADPTLSKLVAPITALQDKIKGLPNQVKGGAASSSTADDLNSAISSIKGQAASAGQPIAEQTPATPSG